MTNSKPEAELPREVENADKLAANRDYPGREIAMVKCAAIEPGRIVVRVYLPVPKLKPTPYIIYAVNREDSEAQRLEAEEAALYRIKNYK